MTTVIYFVRHAKPVESMPDRERALTPEGRQDARRVAECLKSVSFDYAVSSPYVRCVDTIAECARRHALSIHTDERFRERECGEGGNTKEMMKKRWENLSFHEKGGESISMVLKRNAEGLLELLAEHEGESILFGTHGTALSTIFHYYDSEFGFEEFWRIIDYQPYIVKMTFEGGQCVGKEEVLIIYKFS